MRIVLTLVALVFGIAVLFLSLIRTGWEMAEITVENDSLRTEPIFYKIKNIDGGIEERDYKIPNTIILPNSPIYRLKIGRDWLWYLMAQKPQDKSEMARLIADKRFGEAIKSKERTLELITEAVEWLILANKWLDKPNQKIIQASLAYKYEIEIIRGRGEIDSVKYLELIKKLEGIK